MKIQTAPTQSFSEHASSFIYRISMDTKGRINPPSHNKSYIHVIFDAFSRFVVTVPTKANEAKAAQFPQHNLFSLDKWPCRSTEQTSWN